MGKGNKTTSTQQQQQQNTSSTSIDPKIQQQAYSNLDSANQAAASWNPTMQQSPAGFTPDQQAGFDAARNAGNAGAGTLNSAITAANGAANYQPMQVAGSGYNAQGYTGQGYGAQGYNAQGYNPAMMSDPSGYQVALTGPAAQATGGGYSAASNGTAQGYTAQNAQGAQIDRGQVRDISAGNTADALQGYLSKFNPQYQQDVIDASTNDLNRARILATQGNAAQAAQQGAFGGSRHGVTDSLTNDDYLRAVASNSANLRNQGFQTALSSLQQDQGRQLSADQSNQGADYNVRSTNAGLQQGNNQYNTGAANQASQFGANAQNQFHMADTDAQNQAAAFGANANNQANLANTAATNNINLNNTAARNNAGQFNANLAFQGNLANQEANNTAGQFNAQQGNQAGQFNANSLNQANQFSAGARNDAGQFNAGALNQAGQYNAGLAQSANLANQSAGLAGAGLNLQGSQALGSLSNQQNANAQLNAQNLLAIGGQQQQQAQNAQDIEYQNQQAQNNAALERLGIQQQGLAATPYGTTTTGSGTSSGSSTSQTQQSLGSSIASAVGTGLQLAGGISGMMNAVPKAAALPQSAPSALSNGSLFPGQQNGYTLSDERLKHNIKPMKGALSKVAKMKGVNYDWKPGLGFPGGGGAHDSGLLAQEVGRAMPGAVKKTAGGAKAYSMPAVVGLLTSAVNELHQKVSKR